jgi:hypothetical protein
MVCNVGAGDAALCLAFCKPLPCLLLLMWGESVLTTEFDALGFRTGPASCRALGDAAAFKFRGNAKHGKDKLGEIGRGIDNRLGNRTQARPGALHVAGDNQKVGRVTREPVNGGDDDNITVCEGGHELLKLRPVGGRAGNLLAEYLCRIPPP